MAQDELDGIRIARELMANLTSPQSTDHSQQSTIYKEPNYPIDELLGIVSVDTKIPYDCREVIAGL
ncbi:MAG: hypothetical protein IPN09_16805 [Bacteroidetes bacterium]|nr:hypothetical protein [Bacteroidota bacterium]